jgi:hypothetical protein
MKGNKELFSSFDDFVRNRVKLGDDHLINVHGKGTIFVLSRKNEKKDIQDVYYV